MEEPVYHIPALLPECIEALDLRPDGIYIDATYGGGGHSRAIVEHLGSLRDISTDSIRTKTPSGAP